MDVPLPPELEALVRQKIESGQYNSTTEVVQDALWLLYYRDRLREIKLEALRQEVQKGLDSEPAKPLDFEAIKARGRERLAQRQAKRS